MSKTLGGFAFVTQGIKYDYCFEQSIQGMCECCDAVSIIYVCLKNDGTPDKLDELQEKYEHLTVHMLGRDFWEDMVGKTKLSNIQNIAAMCLNTDYQLLVQADEVLHPNSYSAVRKAIETGGEGFLCERVNLWGSPYDRLVVREERMPCSSYVNRLTKRGYWCYDDGENIQSPTTDKFANQIRIVHYGFVRKKEVMKAKIINMQEGVFALGHHDPKLDQSEEFDSTLWFRGADLAPIDFEHPDYMQQWVLDRM